MGLKKKKINAAPSWYTTVSQLLHIDWSSVTARKIQAGGLASGGNRLPNQSMPRSLPEDWLRIHSQNPIHWFPPRPPSPSDSKCSCSFFFSERGRFFLSLFNPEKLWSEGCLFWALEGSGNGMRRQVFPQLSTNPFYLVMPLLIWLLDTHTHQTTQWAPMATHLNQSTRRQTSVGAAAVGGCWRPRCRDSASCTGCRRSRKLHEELCFNSSLPLLVFYQPLTWGCHQQSWQHVSVECSLAIYGHTHMVNKDGWASAGSQHM